MEINDRFFMLLFSLGKKSGELTSFRAKANAKFECRASAIRITGQRIETQRGRNGRLAVLSEFQCVSPTLFLEDYNFLMNWSGLSDGPFLTIPL